MELKLLIPSMVCLIFAVYCVYSTAAAITTAVPPTTIHHTTTTRRHHGNNHGNHHPRPTYSPEKVETSHITFHYDLSSIEQLLVAREGLSCYAYPLNSEESQDIHDKTKLFKLEAHLLHQIQHNSYANWTFEDLSVRSRYFTTFCNSNFTIYRVYRV